MASRYFEIGYGDLTFEMQESIEASIKESLMEAYKTDGEAALKRTWHVQPKTWQEAFVRDNDIESPMWDDLDENSPEFQSYNWVSALDDYAETQAHQKAASSIRHIEIEVTL